MRIERHDSDRRDVAMVRGRTNRLTQPSCGDARLCHRGDLIASLDDARHGPVTLMVAPAGYGKTTLIAQWCEALTRQRVAVAYFAASERERDPAMFLTMLAAAIVRAGVDLGFGASGADEGLDEAAMLDELLLQLALADRPLVLIVDDLERADGPAVSCLLASLIARAPVGVHVLLASRAFPALSSSALRLTGKLRLVDFHELRPRREELGMLEPDTGASELAEAVRAAAASRDEATLDRVLRALRPIHILVSDGAPALRTILREIPDEALRRHPRLEIMRAIACFKAGFFAEGRALLDALRRRTHDFAIDPQGDHAWLEAEGATADLILQCQTVRCSAEVERLHDRAMAAAGADPVIWGAGAVVMMLVHQVRGDLDAADAAITRGRLIYDAIASSRYCTSQIAGHEVLTLLARGRLRQALALIASFQKRAGLELSDDASTPTLLRLMFAAARYEQEFCQTAFQSLTASLAEHSRTESWFDQYAITYPVAAVRMLLRDGMEAALAFIGQARAHASRVEALPDFLVCLEIECRARGGDVAGAWRLAGTLSLEQRVRDPSGDAGWRERDAAAQAWIRLLLASGRDAEALAAARAMAATGERGGRLRTRIKGFVLGTLALAALAREDAARMMLLDAVRLAYPERFVAPFAEEGERLAPMIACLLADAAVDAFARRHLEDIRRAAASLAADHDPDALNRREHEIVELLAEGLSNKLIGRRLGITEDTVKFHLKKVFAKLAVSSRRAVVAKVQTTEMANAAPREPVAA